MLATALVSACAMQQTPASHRVGAGAYNVSAAETMTIGGTVRSVARLVSDFSDIGYAVRTTGTASGTWAVQYSNDYLPGVDDPTSDAKWDTYTSSSYTTPPAAAGSAQTFGVELNFFSYKYVRIKFTGSGGTGPALLLFTAKGGGG